MENKIVTRLYLFIPNLPPWILSRPILADVFTAFRRRNEWAYTFCRMNRPFYRAESFLAFREREAGARARQRVAQGRRRRWRAEGEKEEDGCRVYTFFFARIYDRATVRSVLLPPSPTLLFRFLAEAAAPAATAAACR